MRNAWKREHPHTKQTRTQSSYCLNTTRELSVQKRLAHSTVCFTENCTRMEFYTYLKESVLLTTQKLQESVSHFGEYKLCNDIPAKWRVETPQYLATDIELHTTCCSSRFYYGSHNFTARRMQTNAVRSNPNCWYQLNSVETSLKTSSCSASQKNYSPFMEQHLLDITTIEKNTPESINSLNTCLHPTFIINCVTFYNRIPFSWACNVAHHRVFLYSVKKSK